MKKSTCAFLIVLLLVAALPSAALCGVLRTDITVTSRPALGGGWDLTAVIENTGDAETYDLRAFLFVDGWAEVFSNLGDNPPGNALRLKARWAPERALAGRYGGMVRLHFQEKSGRAHKAFHPFTLQLGEGPFPSNGLEVEVNTPAVHPRAFWRPSPRLEVRVENPHDKPVKAHVQVFLPEGITTPSPSVTRPVEPGATVPVTFPLTLARPLLREARFHVTAWYEHERVHRARYLKGRITVEEGPVLIQVYVVGALILLVVVFLVLFVRGKKTMLKEPGKG